MAENPIFVHIDSFTAKTPEEYRIKKAIRNLGVPFPDVVEEAEIILKRTGKKAIPYLLEAIENGDLESDTIMDEFPRVFALYGKDSVPVLIPMLADENEDISYVAESALQEIGEVGVPLLCKGLSDKNPLIRSKTAYVLGKISDPRAIPALVTALSDKDEDVRYSTKLALSSIGPKCYDNVLPLLNARSKLARSSAISILPLLNRERGIMAIVPFFRYSKEEIWNEVYDSLTNLEPKPIPEMISYLDSKDPEIIMGALHILMNFGDRSLIPTIRTLTRNDNEEVCEVAEWCIKELQKKESAINIKAK